MENKFKDILKELRLEKGMSQEKLANALNLSHGVISLYETGKREPLMSQLIKISKFYNVTIDYLVGIEL